LATGPERTARPEQRKEQPVDQVSVAPTDDLDRYLTKGIHEVNGWCIPHLWQTIAPLAQRIGAGPVAEIGVFEGKFLIGLCKTFGITPAVRALAIDVFDMQEFNLDGAGKGKLDVLRRNLDRHGVGADAVEMLRADSLTLRQRDVDRLLDTHGPMRFFSVDGCHEVVHTVNDIEFAMAMTHETGLIAVDDYTNPNWPGVQEAVAKMYLLRDFAFVPLAVTCNKLLLCSYSYQAAYMELLGEAISDRHRTTRIKRVRRFGFDTLTIQPDTKVWTSVGPAAQLA
jgi:hypothetical protein